MKFEAYCVKCKRKRSCIDVKYITTFNQKKALEGHSFCLKYCILLVLNLFH